jgi:hypothetical protein
LPEGIDGDLSKGVEALPFAPRKKSVLKEMSILAHCLPAELSRLTILEELPDRLANCRRLDSYDTDFTGSCPGGDQLRRGIPRGLVQRSADLLPG